MGRAMMSASAENVGVLSIGTVLGGSTVNNRGWVEGTREIQREIVLARDNVSSNINVEVVFHVPGNILSPDYEGLRTGSYWKSKALLQVQVALPAVAPADPRSALIQLIWDALDVVDSWAATKGKSADTAGLRGIVAKVEGLNG